MIAAISRPPLTSRSLAGALAAHLWMRHRIGLSILGTYLLVASSVARWFGYTHHSIEGFLAINVLPLLLGLLYLIALFTNPEADLSSAGSGYPSYLLTLPVRTRDLVFWPVLFGTAITASAWLITSCLILRSIGLAAPIVWPAAILASTCAWIQALFWTPLRIPALRILLSGLIIPIVVVVSVVAQESPGASWGITIGSLLLIPAAYLLSLDGVSRARRGDVSSPFTLAIPVRKIQKSETFVTELPSFSSRLKAQVWAEERRHGHVLAVLVFGACLLASLPILWVRETTSLFAQTPVELFVRGVNVEVNVGVKVALVVLLVTPGLAFCTGCGSNPGEGARKQSALPPFLAARPVLSSEIALAKMLMAVQSTLRAWAVILVFLLFWLLVPARHAETEAPLLFILIRISNAKTWAAVATVLAFLVFTTWRSQVQTLFVNVAGRIRVSQLYFLLTMVFCSSVLFSFAAMSAHPESQPQIQSNIHNLVVSSLILKALAVGPVFYLLIRKRLATPRFLVGTAIVWCAIAGCTYAWLNYLLPVGLISARALAASIILYLPLVRLVLAPLSLDWNRHR